MNPTNKPRIPFLACWVVIIATNSILGLSESPSVALPIPYHIAKARRPEECVCVEVGHGSGAASSTQQATPVPIIHTAPDSPHWTPSTWKSLSSPGTVATAEMQRLLLLIAHRGEGTCYALQLFSAHGIEIQQAYLSTWVTVGNTTPLLSLKW